MSHPENNPDFLAAELVTDEDGSQKIRCTWPDDPLIAESLFNELRYRFEARTIEDAMRQRKMVLDAQHNLRAEAAARRLDGKMGIRK